MRHLIEKAKECYSLYSFYPISFCLPHEIDITKNCPLKQKEMAHIIPGNLETYIFKDEESYNKDYQISKFGITCKKAGWDCLRHLEIISNKCLPIFTDIEMCPEFNMIHYPKHLFRNIKQFKDDLASNPDLYSLHQKQLVQHFNSFLTCRKMVEYCLRVSGHWGKIDSVLFIDSELPRMADYMSVTFLTGLKQLFGDRCEVCYPVDYIYQDTQVDTKSLYGMGFSYSKALPSHLRTREEREQKELTDLKYRISRRKYSLVVYGSIGRCMTHFLSISKYYGKNEIIGIHGEDANSKNDRRNIIKHEMKNRMTLFVREFEELD